MPFRAVKVHLFTFVRLPHRENAGFSVGADWFPNAIGAANKKILKIGRCSTRKTGTPLTL